MAIPQSTVSTPTPSVGGLPTPPVDYNQGRDIARENQKLKDMSIDPNAAARMNQKTLLEATYTPQELANIPYYGYVTQRDKFKEQTGKNLAPGGSTPEPTASVLRPLEQALRIKQEIGNQPLGEADAFKMAGLDPYINLSQSLKQHSQDIDYKYSSFANIVGRVGEGLRDTYNVALQGYKTASDEYNTEIERMNKIVEKQMDYEEAMKKIEVQHQNSMDLAEWTQKMQDKYKDTDPTPNEKLNAVAEGYVWDSSSNDWMDASSAQAIFDFSGEKSKYRSSGLECGESYRLATGDRVGDLYTDKIKKATHQDNPGLGNGLVLPIGGKNGHIETVIGYDPDTKVVSTMSHNRGLDGKQTFENYTIDELNKQYGDKWGFTDSKLLPEFEEKLKAQGDNSEVMGAISDLAAKVIGGDMSMTDAKDQVAAIEGLSKKQVKEYQRELVRVVGEGGVEDKFKVKDALTVGKYLPEMIANLELEGVKLPAIAQDADFISEISGDLEGLSKVQALEEIKMIIKEATGDKINDKQAESIYKLTQG